MSSLSALKTPLNPQTTSQYPCKIPNAKISLSTCQRHVDSFRTPSIKEVESSCTALWAFPDRLRSSARTVSQSLLLFGVTDPHEIPKVMSTKGLTVSDALRSIRQCELPFEPVNNRKRFHLHLSPIPGRPQIRPNYGFIKQLQAFATFSCNPTPNTAAYTSWKRRHRMDVTNYLNKLNNTIPVIQNNLYVTR